MSLTEQKVIDRQRQTISGLRVELRKIKRIYKSLKAKNQRTKVKIHHITKIVKRYSDKIKFIELTQ